MRASQSSTLYKTKAPFGGGAFVLGVYNIEMPEKLFVAVKALVFVGGKCLLLKNRNKHWDLPGGRINTGEPLLTALGRELCEELPTLKSYKPPRLIDAYRLEETLPDGAGLVFLFYVVEAENFTVELTTEHEGYEWVGIEMLDSLKIGGYRIEPGYFSVVKQSLSVMT